MKKMTFKAIEVVNPVTTQDMERLRQLEAESRLATDRDYPDGEKTGKVEDSKEEGETA